MRLLSNEEKQAALGFLRGAVAGSISLQFCERFDESSKIWNLKEHAHPFLELIYFIEGKARVASDGNTLDVTLYDLLAYPPGVAHQETIDLGSRQEIVCLWLDLGTAATITFPFKLSDDEGELGWLCLCLYRNHVRQGEASLELEQHLLKSLLLVIMQKLSMNAHSGSLALDRCRTYIDEHYAEAFDVGMLAQLVYVSPSYLSRLFRKHLGTTPLQYRNSVRVDKAKHLLLVKSASVEEIADFLGFEDSRYFSQLFKSATSLTPSEFRKKFRAL